MRLQVFLTLFVLACGCVCCGDDPVASDLDGITPSIALYDCAGIEESGRDECYYMAALSGKNEALCQHVKNLVERDACIKFVAKLKSDETVCTGIGDDFTKDTCLFDIAVKGGGAGVCEKISDVEAKGFCTAIVSKNKAYCAQNTGGEERSFCNAVVDSNPASCLGLDDEGLKNMCLTIIAQIRGDPGVCSKISVAQDRSACELTATKI
ncbi:MAG TPA: hypothetical protein ENN13_03430 [Candidatus Altiarchaeales archaeon]|nr:hypothetical protein [Candidatus Altiarchaeales archaeon]